MTTTTRNNHLADDLAAYMAEDDWDAGITLLDEALAAERRATVDRIKAAISAVPFPISDGAIYGKSVEQYAQRVLAILDEEAARV